MNEKDNYYEQVKMDPVHSIELERIRTIHQYIQLSDSVLDVGCGDGRVINLLKNKIVIGMDYSDNFLRYVKREKKKWDIRKPWPFPNDSFEVIILADLLEHLTNKDQAFVLNEAKRVAKNRVIINVPFQEDLDLSLCYCPNCGCKFHKNLHKRSYTLPDLKQLLASFKICSFSYIPEFKSILPSFVNSEEVYYDYLRESYHKRKFGNIIFFIKRYVLRDFKQQYTQQVNLLNKQESQNKKFWKRNIKEIVLVCEV
jgi:ubiquinone/menaquinone biosynthesis C-methylase UbiE